MVIVGDILIHDDVLSEYFLCKLDACKGACCWEGDWGAPLETEELHTLEAIYPELQPFLRPEARAVIEDKGLYVWYDEPKEYGTALMDDGACVFLTFDERGIAQCGIEQAWKAGAVDYRKPISCHLYPVRVSKNEDVGFEALNYDRWDICSEACRAGASEKVRLYRFVREALIRKYGTEWYEELEAAAAYLEYE